MTRTLIVTISAGVITLAAILNLVRHGQLRVKYAGLWLAVGLAAAVLAVFPPLLDRVADWLGVADPPNLLFFIGLLVLLVVTVQLSVELSRAEERIRTLAEEVAFLRHEVDGSDQLASSPDAVGPDVDTGSGSPRD